MSLTDNAKSLNDMLPYPYHSVDIRQVKVGGEIGRRINITIKNNLLMLDIDGDFLEPLHRRQGKSGHYVGIGKLLDAFVRFAAGKADPYLLKQKEYVVRKTIQTQTSDGYIGYFPPPDRVWTLWDVHETAYITYGLASDYELFHENESLQAARHLAAYLMKAMLSEPDRRVGSGTSVLRHTCLGLDKAMLALFRLTGDHSYLDFITQRLDVAVCDIPIVCGRWGALEGHAYDFMDRCIAQLQYYKIKNNPRLLDSTRRALDFLLHKNGLLITGSCGHSECWHDTQIGYGNLEETCTTAYWIFLLDELIRLDGKSLYGDLMERAIFNALFAAQSPDGRCIRYFTPFEGRRYYWPADTYCCPNNYRRIIASLPTMIYYRANDGVLVNLYTDSSAQVELDHGNSVKLQQDTDYPSSGRVVIHVQPRETQEFAVYLRMPRWCPSPEVTVNGTALEAPPTCGTLYKIHRCWKANDHIEVNLPMTWRLVRGRQAQAGRAAIMRGPMLFTIGRPHNRHLMHESPMAFCHLAIDTESLGEPLPDRTVRPGGLVCPLQAWRFGPWYYTNQPPISLRATEFADPDGESTYFDLLNPSDARVKDDELIA